MVCTSVWRIALPVCISFGTRNPAEVQTLQKVQGLCSEQSALSSPPLFILNYRFYGNIIALTAQKSSDCRRTSDNTFFSVVQMDPESVKQETGGKLPEFSSSANAQPEGHSAGCTGPVCMAHVFCTPLSKRTETWTRQWAVSNVASQPKARHFLQHLWISGLFDSRSMIKENVSEIFLLSEKGNKLFPNLCHVRASYTTKIFKLIFSQNLCSLKSGFFP